MRHVNILYSYSVTMQDDGVSKFLSIKLDEAEEKEKPPLIKGGVGGFKLT